MPETAPHVGLFVTCLVDMMRPEVAFASIRLLEDAGCRVSVPRDQTCCGQPAYNSGDAVHAKSLARKVIAVFEGFDYTVLPSGSCAGMIARHYPTLFADDPVWGPRARALAERTFELTAFLNDVLKTSPRPSRCPGTATYHDSCSGLRELGIKRQPRELLSRVEGLTIVESTQSEACCGFGGTFCAKYPEISERMVDRKVDDALATRAEMLLGGDMGCLMNLAGRLRRRGAKMEVRHVAEVLAGILEAPAIGADET